jgi:hypothetical protein
MQAGGPEYTVYMLYMCLLVALCKSGFKAYWTVSESCGCQWLLGTQPVVVSATDDRCGKVVCYICCGLHLSMLVY